MSVELERLVGQELIALHRRDWPNEDSWELEFGSGMKLIIEPRIKELPEGLEATANLWVDDEALR